MNQLVGILVLISGVLGVIGSAIALKYWLIVTIMLSLLNLIGIITIPWFAGLFTISAIGTGLWMLFGGIIMWVSSMVIIAIGGAIGDSK